MTTQMWAEQGCQIGWRKAHEALTIHKQKTIDNQGKLEIEEVIFSREERTNWLFSLK